MNEGLDQLPVSSPVPTVACMTRGDVRGLAGRAWTGLVGLAVSLLSQATVTELYQNPIYLAGKGFDFERKQNPRKLGTAWEEKR